MGLCITYSITDFIKFFTVVYLTLFYFMLKVTYLPYFQISSWVHSCKAKLHCGHSSNVNSRFITINTYTFEKKWENIKEKKILKKKRF